MSAAEAVRVALTAIRANKMRSVLTMLGIIIGVASVITMIALGKGAEADITERVQAMGTNVLHVRPGPPRGPNRPWGAQDQDTLTLADADAIAKRVPTVDRVAPQVSRNMQVRWRNQTAQISVVGSTPDYFHVNNHPVEVGREVNEADAHAGRAVCTIGTTVVNNMFGRNDPIGERIRVGNMTFEVIGVLREKGSMGWRDPDDVVVVPLALAMRRLFGRDRLDTIAVSAASADTLDKATEEVTRLVRRLHRISPGRPDDFNVRGQTEMLQMFTETSKTFTVLLAGIATLSLLVGGIGVMNIMLVSVTERTREIGIRKAVGARRKDILMQFLIESMTLCIVGGLIGVGLGITGAAVLAHFTGWRTLVGLGSIVLAVSFSGAVGVGFGLYPARRAALLDPIEALRYE